MILAAYDKENSVLKINSPELTLDFIRSKLTNISLFTFTPINYEGDNAKEKGVATIPCYSPEQAETLIRELRSRGLEVRC